MVPLIRVRFHAVGAPADAPPVFETNRPALAMVWLAAIPASFVPQVFTMAYVGETFSPALSDAIDLRDPTQVYEAVQAEILDEHRQQLDKPAPGDAAAMERAHRAGDAHPGADCSACLADCRRRSQEA